MVRKTQEECEKTRSALLESALICFAEQGIAHTSLAQIAAHAGFTRGAIYWHFKNKAELFAALHQEIELPFDYLLHSIEARGTDNIHFAEFYGLARRTLLHIFEHPRSYLLLEILLVKCEFTQDMHSAFEKLLASYSPLYPMLQAIFDRFKAENLLKDDIHHAVIAQSMLAFFHGSITQAILKIEHVKLEQDVDHLLKMFFYAIIKDQQLLQSCVNDYAK